MVPWTTPYPDCTMTFDNETGTYSDTSCHYNVSSPVFNSMRRDFEKETEAEAKEASRQKQMRRERKHWRGRAKRHDFRQAKWSMNGPRCR